MAAEPPQALSGTIDSITIASPPVIELTLKDEFGRGAVGLRGGSSGNVRFSLAKLIPGTNGNPTVWQSYINRVATANGVSVTQATAERTGTWVDHGDGTYTYTFANDITRAVDPVTTASITYDASLTHRLVLQVSGGSLPALNLVHDFVPNGGASTASRSIVDTASCNECHGELRAHGSRYDTDYCVVCHNPGTTDPTAGAVVNMPVMIHKIHRGAGLANGFELGGEDFSEVVFPQQINNCRKCHNGADAATPEGDNWKKVPNRDACGACHDSVNFDTGAGHAAGPQANNSLCTLCHTETAIETVHASENPSPNNPNLPAGLSAITYEIVGVTVNAQNQPVIEFKILRDGTALDLLNLPADLTTATNRPSFLVAYSMAQGGHDDVADWTQLGRTAGQPASVSIQNLINGSQGSLVAGTNGSFIATITANGTAYPAGATRRGVALQGYFAQTLNGANTPLHAVSVVGTAAGDEPRRQIVDSAKCGNCHEWFEGHGGNRVYNMDVCVICHNPNLSSSGRAADPAQAAPAELVAAFGADPLQWPEASQNFRDLIHGIHSSAVRTEPFQFVRDRGTSGIFYYDWSHVGFPGVINNCETCHKAGTYEVPVAMHLLPSTDRTTTGDPAEDRATVQAMRASVPNPTDLVSSPTASACAGCHTGAGAAAHMEQNGAALQWPRGLYQADTPYETCGVCHGSGKLADLDVVHGL